MGTRTALFDEQWFADAAEYLYFQVKRGSGAAVPEFVTSRDAAEIVNGFEQHLTAHRFAEPFRAARKAVEQDLPSTFRAAPRLGPRLCEHAWRRGKAGVCG
jgi:hypothetical protein